MLSEAQRRATERKINELTEHALELEREAQRLRRLLDREDATPAGRAALEAKDE